jgi:nucleoside-diphosphate-sugar epimerase
MRILVIGGTGFLGGPLVRALRGDGHEVAIFHRGEQCAGDEVGHFHGDRREMEAYGPAMTRFAPEVVVDLICGSGAAARRTLRVLAAPRRRMVLISSLDVYRAWAVFHGVDRGPIEPAPQSETARLRSSSGLYPAATLAHLRRLHPWMMEGYDKLGMERAATAWPAAPGAWLTILRLPPLYGPGDPHRRLYALWRRMRDGRGAILLPRGWAEWRSPRGYVINMAHGVALAVTNPRAAGRVYNLADAGNFSEAEWATAVGQVAGWRGRVVVASPAHMPPHLRVTAVTAVTAQHCAADTSRIRQELGYREPVSREEAIRATLIHERDHPPVNADPGLFDYAAEDAVLSGLGVAASRAG